MTWEMYQALVDACDRADDDPAVRVLILKGAGGKAFVAGTDIAPVPELSTAGGRHQLRAAHRSGARSARTRHEGDDRPDPGRGGGWRLRDRAHAATCAIATPESSFGIPVARTLGNCLSGATYSRLVDLLGPGLVKDMLLTGRFIPAAEALALGIVSRLEPAENIDTAVRECALADCRERAADDSRDEGDDPPHHGRTAPAAR